MHAVAIFPTAAVNAHIPEKSGMLGDVADMGGNGGQRKYSHLHWISFLGFAEMSSPEPGCRAQASAIGMQRGI
jgi:hypothetical protein